MMSLLTDEKLNQAFAVWESAGWNDEYKLSHAEFVRSWKGSAVKVCSHHEGRMIAIGRANTDGVLYSMIHDVVVLPQFRGSGYGKQTVNEIIGILTTMGVRSIQLMSACGQSAFYEKFGFKKRPYDGPGMEYNGASAQQTAESDAASAHYKA